MTYFRLRSECAERRQQIYWSIFILPFLFPSGTAAECSAGLPDLFMEVLKTSPMNLCFRHATVVWKLFASWLRGKGALARGAVNRAPEQNQLFRACMSVCQTFPVT